jgi:2-dehydropantoate 2-reductase
LLVCTKAQQTLDAIKTIRSRLAPNAVIVLLQNGMGVRELLQRDLSINGLNDVVILHALSTEGAFRTGRFHVTHAGLGETVIGAIDTAQHNIAQHVTQTLQCERPIRCVSDIQDRLWLKLAVNSVINPLTALHRCRNGELLQLPNFDAIVSKLCAELAMVARAEHIALNDERMRKEIYRVTQMTAHNKSSMLQDIEAGRPTEIDFINGFIVERAQAHALPCREHADLLNAVRALQP